jgi:Trypsin
MGTVNWHKSKANRLSKTTTEKVVHEQYNSMGVADNDIALIKLQEEVPFNGCY